MSGSIELLITGYSSFFIEMPKKNLGLNYFCGFERKYSVFFFICIKLGGSTFWISIFLQILRKKGSFWILNLKKYKCNIIQRSSTLTEIIYSLVSVTLNWFFFLLKLKIYLDEIRIKSFDNNINSDQVSSNKIVFRISNLSTYNIEAGDFFSTQSLIFKSLWASTINHSRQACTSFDYSSVPYLLRLMIWCNA